MLYKAHILEINVAGYLRGEWLSDLGVIIRIGRFSVQSPIGARPGLGTQSRYEVPGNLRIEITKTQ